MPASQGGGPPRGVWKAGISRSATRLRWPVAAVGNRTPRGGRPQDSVSTGSDSDISYTYNSDGSSNDNNTSSVTVAAEVTAHQLSSSAPHQVIRKRKEKQEQISSTAAQQLSCSAERKQGTDTVLSQLTLSVLFTKILAFLIIYISDFSKP